MKTNGLISLAQVQPSELTSPLYLPHHEADGAEKTANDCRPSCYLHLPIREHPSRIPDQMSQSMQDMKDEWKTKETFHCRPGPHRQTAKPLYHACSIKVPTE